MGAELISSELADAPQAADLEIWFHGKYERMTTRGEPYQVLKISYSGTRDYQPGWRITIRPAPRALKHDVQDALVREFLPRIRQWLIVRANLNSRHGFEAAAVILDEKAETMLRLEEWRSAEARSN